MDSTEPEAFQTHLTYISGIRFLSRGLELTANTPIRATAEEKRVIEGSLKLTRLTELSIQSDREIIRLSEEYCEPAALWVPTKTYYLIHYWLRAIDYLITKDSSSLRMKHDDCVETFTKRLTDRHLVFNKPLFNKVAKSEIWQFREKTRGQHLGNPGIGFIYNRVLKKAADEKLREFRRRQKSHDLSLEKRKNKTDKFKAEIAVSIFDYLHQMRLRASYRGLAFLTNASPDEALQYWKTYATVAKNFHDCFDKFARKINLM